MVRIKGGAKWTGSVKMSVIAHYHATGRCGDLPFAGLCVSNLGRPPRRVLRSHVFHVGGKVAHLVKRVPNRHIQSAFCFAFADANADLREMTRRIGERDKIFSRLRTRTLRRGTRHWRNGRGYVEE